MRRPTLALLLGCLLLVAGVSALDGYDYYQTIEYAGCDQEVYQQDIIIHRSAGTAYNETSGGLETWHIFVGEHCREDYGDIRFTNSTGAELAYYLWPDYDSSSARFTVRLENATVAGTLTVYYGNPGATTTSDGNTVYLLFDHFDGTTLNETKWSKVGTPTISNSWVRVDSSNEEIRSLQTFGVNTILEGKGNIYPAAYHIFGWGIHPYVPISIFQYGYPASGVYNARNHVTSTVSVSLGSGLTGNHTWAIHRAGTGSTKFYVDNALVANLTSQVPTTNMPVLLQQHVTGTGNSNFDYILVRAYSAAPPAATAFSGEYQTLQPFPGCSNDPTDPDADGLYEDINGNARWDFQDIILFFQHLVWCEANQPVSLFDWNSNGRCDFDDVFRLWSNGGMI